MFLRRKIELITLRISLMKCFPFFVNDNQSCSINGLANLFASISIVQAFILIFVKNISMFKILTLGILFYLLYNLVLKPKQIQQRKENTQINKDRNTSFDEGEYTDYEEVD